jgi:uncharacterized protein
MPFDNSDEDRDQQPYTAVKLLITGGFGVGKTTMIGSVSETPPLHTEELLTELGRDVDDLAMVRDKTTTTVTMDFGRITISPEVVLYLFGTPGQDRFWFMWDELAIGSLGAVVLADTRRLDRCFAAVDFLERRRIPFLIAVNDFADAPRYPLESVRRAVHVTPATPVVSCDARDRESSKNVLITLLEHVLTVSDMDILDAAARGAGA